MRVRMMTVATVVAVTLVAGCRNPFGRQYEYEEQLYLRVDGSATVVIDASIAALVALRQLPLDPAQSNRVERDELRALFASQGCENPSVGQPWIRKGRRFVQVDIAVDDVRELSRCAPLAWSSYAFERTATEINFLQEMGDAAHGDPGAVNWDGSELVGFKLHAPSTVTWHNVRRLEDNEPGEAGRGNILTWEQRLTDRLAGKPITMKVILAPDSTLARTLLLFGGAFIAALSLLALLIWITVRRGKRRPPLASRL